MNVFVIHSGADYDATNGIISTLKKKVYSLNTLILKNGSCFWKLDASQKIKKAQMVLFVVGENSHKSPYIAWEIKEAIKGETKDWKYWLTISVGYAEFTGKEMTHEQLYALADAALYNDKNGTAPASSGARD